MLSGSKLKYLRYMHGKTQQDVANWCNITHRYLEQVEAGQEIPSRETYNAFLNCIYGIGKPVPQVPRPNRKKKDKKEG